MKSNLTKKMIAVKFCAMLQEKSIDKLTVKGIVEECGINRQTFYYHFEDIYDLMRWTLKDEIESFRLENPVNEKDLQEQILRLFRFLHANKTIILHGYNPINRIYYERFLKEEVSAMIAKRLSVYPQAQKVPEEKRDFLCNVLAIGSVGFIFEWIEEGMPDEYKVRLEDYFTMFHGIMEFTLNHFR